MTLSTQEKHMATGSRGVTRYHNFTALLQTS